MRLKLISKTVVKFFLPTLILAIPILVGIFDFLDFGLKLFLVILVMILYSLLTYFEVRSPRISVDELLELTIRSLYGSHSHNFRANVMVFDEKKKLLKIKHSYNMMGAKDKNIKLKTGQGCAGQAFIRKKSFCVDLMKAEHRDYNVNPNEVWNDMKSVISNPLISGNGDVIGVMNIDSKLLMKHTKFMDENIYNVINAFGELIMKVSEIGE